MFKRFIATGVTACAGIVLSIASSSASALALDQKLGEANLGNSGDASELATMEGFANTELTLLDKRDVDLTMVLQDPDTANQWYINVAPDEPGYFALKFGIGGLNVAYDTFFFKNVADLTQLVFSNEQVLGITGSLACGDKCNIGRLSHYTTFNGEEHNVPEPLPLTLLGIGIAGIGLSRRQRRDNKPA